MSTQTVSAGSFDVVEIPVKLCKRGRKVDAGKLLRETRMDIEQVEFEPDNSRIGCESYGLQSMPISILDSRWNLQAHKLAEFGIVPMLPVISQTTLPSPSYPVRRPVNSPYFSVWNGTSKLKKQVSYKAPKYSWL